MQDDMRKDINHLMKEAQAELDSKAKANTGKGKGRGKGRGRGGRGKGRGKMQTQADDADDEHGSGGGLDADQGLETETAPEGKNKTPRTAAKTKPRKDERTTVYTNAARFLRAIIFLFQEKKHEDLDVGMQAQGTTQNT